MLRVFRKPTARDLILQGMADGTFSVRRTSPFGDFGDFCMEVERDIPGLPVIRFTIWQSTTGVHKWWGIVIVYTYHSSESWMDEMDKIKIFHAAQRVHDARIAKAKAAVDAAAHDAMMAKLTGGK